MVTDLSMDRRVIVGFCRRHHIRRLALFGSVLRPDFRPDSDVDALVEFEPNHVPGLAFFAMQRELSEILGRKVDLNTPADLSRYYRQEILAEAETVFRGGCYSCHAERSRGISP
jgi:predicted nucleotidyltransferase